MDLEKGQGAPATTNGYILCNGHKDGTETSSANGTLATDKLLAYPLEARTNDVEKVQEKHRDEDSEVDEEDQVKRESWGRKTEYVLSMIGFCVGLGNIWRFPYVCIRNGGGAFLIPFFVCLIFVAMPVYILEVSLGQFTSRGPFHVWNISRLFKGIGMATVCLCLLCYWYYNMILGWTVIYMANSLKSPLPWSVCGQDWNTDRCITRELKGPGRGNSSDDAANSTLTSLLSHMSNSSLEVNNTSLGLDGNSTLAGNVTKSAENGTLSTEEFWKHNVLEMSSGFHDMAGLPWHTTVSLVVVSIVVLVGIIRGIKSSGKVVYVTATLPYLLLTVLLIRGATLPGAAEGVLFYVKPDFKKLLLIQTWIEAAIQVFYSLGPTWGGLIAMASYNKFNNNCLRDSLILTFVCEGTSIYGGFAIFTILGHMAYTAGVPVETFSDTGPGLAFIVYPEGISYLPLPQLWGVLFFLMLLTLGLDSQFTMGECVLTSIVDQWPRTMTKWRSALSTGYVAFYFILSLPFAARGGIYIFQLVDWYIATFALLGQAVLESVVVAWIYGADNFCRDIEMMIGYKPSYFFVILWKFVSPVLLTIVLVCTLVTYSAPTYGDYVYGPGGIAFGWIIATTGFTSIPLTAIWVLLKAEGSLWQRIKSSCAPDPSFGPADPKLKALYRMKSEDASLCEIRLPRWRRT